MYCILFLLSCVNEDQFNPEQSIPCLAVIRASTTFCFSIMSSIISNNKVIISFRKQHWQSCSIMLSARKMFTLNCSKYNVINISLSAFYSYKCVHVYFIFTTLRRLISSCKTGEVWLILRIHTYTKNALELKSQKYSCGCVCHYKNEVQIQS